MENFMEEYLQELKTDFEAGKLLMDCIMPDAYDYLAITGRIRPAEWVNHWPEAVKYRMLQVERMPRTLEQLLVEHPTTLAEKEAIEQQRRETIAKKMAVYEYLRTAPAAFIENQ